ncbi:aminopeptidase N [Corynebacterium lizhenjunii]|uniref:Aminopeptidase N n=1 Tax=Corynebacterium lizhenjunii TaxID=2709394 RepID=A0A7T0KF29_9CORY|nr:aminopeptidase N [Corynebacterium lizhenjunii]QPK79151.1 aminopeptidase N [Corynebacterium lizhenjunii]
MPDSNLTYREAQARSAAFELERYDLDLDLSQAPTGEDFQVKVTIVGTSAQQVDPAACFVDFLGSAVGSVEFNGTEVPVDFSNGRVSVPQLAQPGEFTLRISGRASYSRSGQGLHRMVDTADGNVYLYSHLEPSDARRIFPCFDQPDLKAVFHTSITAPDGWAVLANQPEISRTTQGEGETTGDHEGIVTVSFAPTPRLSTYLTAFAAGPYVGRHTTWTAPDGSGLQIELGAWARASMAEYVDEEILRVTSQGLDFYHQAYAYPYPWGKYDSIFVPEYNLGAMENPGLVTFTETYLFRSQATRWQRQGRTNTILHEMAHMWFGDLVTPQWWDDLWLKESFAEFMGADASIEATEYAEAWTSFASARKNWAYTQDQLPTTHPIKAEIPDVDAARQNFDGITYAKGAAVLKQLVHYIGRDNFYAGARDYFQAHAFGSATFEDLLDSLQAHTERDLNAWAKAWLRTWGPDTLTPRVVDGTLHIDATAADTLRPHRLSVSLFDADLRKYQSLDVDLPGEATTQIAEVGNPALIVLNDGDHTYAKVRFDATSLATLRSGLSRIEDELTRAVVWTSLWQATRDGEWDAREYVGTVLDHAPAEPSPGLLATALANAQHAVNYYIDRDDFRVQFADALWELLQDPHRAPSASDAQLTVARTTISALAATPAPEGTERLRFLLDGQLEGLRLDPDVRWAILGALASRDAVSLAELEQERAADNTLTGAAAFLGARNSYPSRTREVFDLVRQPRAYSNAEVDELLAAYHSPHADRADFAEEFFDVLPALWADHPIEIANRLVRGLYPEQESALARTDAFLAQGLPDGDAAGTSTGAAAAASSGGADAGEIPGALRRVLLECQDSLARTLRVRAAQPH